MDCKETVIAEMWIHGHHSKENTPVQWDILKIAGLIEASWLLDVFKYNEEMLDAFDGSPLDTPILVEIRPYRDEGDALFEVINILGVQKNYEQS